MRIFDFEKNIQGVGVVLRASLNAPIENGVITDTFRIEKAIPTLERLSKKGARTTVIAHIGRDPVNSLKPVFEEIKKHTTLPIQFADGVIGESVCRKVEALHSGDVLLLENVRREPGEKENNQTFAEQLASYGTVYINDSFPVAHRNHASVVGISHYIPGFAGPQFMNEYNGISPALSPKSPNIAIVGGAKFVTKEPLIRTLLQKYDAVFIGGALAHDFFVAKGYEIGKSLASRTSHVNDLIENEKIILPTDVVVRGNNGVETKKVEEVLPSDTIVDVGPQSLTAISSRIEEAQFVLWNGPMGNFEEGFSEATEALARTIAEAEGVSVVGGGDTIAAIQKLSLNDSFTHVSTAGGAMLQFIAEGTLPGIKALT